MEAKLKQGTVITAAHEGGYFWKIDDTVVFTDTPEGGMQIYNKEGKKLFFPKNHDLVGCGFPENMFENLSLKSCDESSEHPKKLYVAGNWLRAYFQGEFSSMTEAWSYLSRCFLLHFPSTGGDGFICLLWKKTITDINNY